MTAKTPPSRCVSWHPSWLSSRAMRRAYIDSDEDAAAGYYGLRPAAGQWGLVGDGLRAAREALQAMPVARIVDALDQVCSRWAGRDFVHRARARGDVVAATGFSPEAVDASFDVELGNYRAATLRNVLRREFGDAQVLDRFSRDEALGGHALAVGPRVTTVVCSGNVPGLPALSVVRALLVKSAVIVKVASGEPTFAAHFIRSLAEVEPVLADAVVVTYWRGDDADALAGAVGQADAVIAYGGANACASVKAQVQPHQRYVEHGHKVSAGILMQSYIRAAGLHEVAARAALDVSMFNQHACIAPQVYLVEYGEHGAREFAVALSAAMARYASGCPLGTVPQEDAAALQLYRASTAWAAAGSSSRGFWRAPGLDWTVTLAPELVSVPGTGNRVISVVPVPGAGDVTRVLRPIGALLQNVGLGALGEEFWQLAAELAALGACRVSEPGHMASPTVIWRHDGMPCLAMLVRWCDIEQHRETRFPQPSGASG